MSEGILPGRVTISMAIDGIADAARRAITTSPSDPAGELCCDACDQPITGEPAGSGLYLWTRGDEIRIEEPPLCASCATAIGVTALAQWSVEEEEG